MKMKILFVTTFSVILFVCVLAEYEHNYGHGHGGGHGFYGYPVGRKWGYSTYIKHPPPKHNSYGGNGYGGPRYGYGGNSHGNQRYGFGRPGFGHGFFPNFGSGYEQGYGGGYPTQSHTYQRQYIPYGGYGELRKRQAENNVDYNSHGHHRNNNYGGGDGYGAHSRMSNTGYTRPDFEELGGFDSFFGKDFPNYLVDLNLPENFQQLIY